MHCKLELLLLASVLQPLAHVSTPGLTQFYANTRQARVDRVSIL